MSELKVKNLRAEYNSPILKDISFSIFPGKLTALCGKNGSGKSTLLSIMAGIQESSLKVSGAVFLDDRNLQTFKRKELAQKIAFMGQTEFSTWNFNVLEYVLQGRFSYSKNGYYSSEDRKICEEAISEIGIEELASRNVHELSGGEFQKVRIARALVQQPEFMLLDEPASSLDFVYEPQLLKLLKSFCLNKNIGILLSMHDVNLASQFADEMIFLTPQKPVIIGKPQEVMTLENLQKVYGVEFNQNVCSEYFVPKL